MKMVQQISRQVGEFDLDVMSDIFKLVMRLTPICRSTDGIGNNSIDQQDVETNNGSSEMSTSENMPAGTVSHFFSVSLFFFFFFFFSRIVLTNLPTSFATALTTASWYFFRKLYNCNHNKSFLNVFQVVTHSCPLMNLN